ncbi:MAG: glutamate racemase [Acidaminococcaceae bacterium]
MLTKTAPIGVLDSGVGGLSVLKALKELLPQEEFIYLGDTARTPYGSRSEAQVRQFVGEMLDYFDACGAKLVVIACNTLTVLGIDTLQGTHAYRLVGMSKGVQLALASTRKKTVGVLATEFTIRTGAHKKELLAADATVQVVPQACPKFVPLIEGEGFGTPELAAAIQEYTTPLRLAGVDTIILSCTHYPFIKKELAAVLPGVRVLDPAEQTALDALAILERDALAKSVAEKGTTTICFTADVERGRRLAGKMFATADCRFQLVKLN